MENTQNLIGRKFKGFRFEEDKENLYMPFLDFFIGKALTIDKVIKNTVTVDIGFKYPLKEVLNHLIPEETEIPELPEGVLMLVSDDNENWAKRLVIGKKNNLIWCYNDKKTLNINYKYCKPIPKLPNYTLQELKEKIGHDFNLID